MGLSLAAGGGGSDDDDDDDAAGDDIANDADAGPTVAVAVAVVVETNGVDVILASFLAFNSSFHVYKAYKLSSSL